MYVINIILCFNSIIIYQVLLYVKCYVHTHTVQLLSWQLEECIVSW